MREFELAEPRSLAAAIDLLDAEDPTIRPISGGTALMLMMKAGAFQPTRLVSLGGIDGRISEIAATAEGGVRIGALCTLAMVEKSPLVRRLYPVVGQAMQRLANVRVRNVARIGGNLAHADPHMDLPPVLSALGGEVVIAGPAGERRVAVERLFVGYYETVLAANELITELVLPPPTGWSAAYLKCTTRSADDWPALGIAAAVKLADGVVTDIVLMLGAAAAMLTRLKAAEAVLRGHALDPALLGRAAEAAAEEVELLDDSRGSAAYKKHLLRIYLGRAIRQAVQGIQP
jgi:carbon-monoxide dehydrogenase medium subunit